MLAYPFNEPVDTVMYRDYLNYVRAPMDFGTIKGKIPHYKTPYEFESDVRLVFENAKKYNAPETEVREMARLLEIKFDERWTKSILPRIEELKTAERDDEIAFKQTKADNVTVEAETRVDECCRLLLNKLHALSEEIKYVQCLAAAECMPLTEHEQLRLGWELTTLSSINFQRVMNLVLMRHPGLIATMKNNTMELDLNKMDCLTLRQLQDFVKHCSKQQAAEQDQHRSQCQDRKRPRRLDSIDEKLDDAEHWPAVAFGLGLKPYDAEVEPFVPPEADDIPPLPFSSVFLGQHSSGPSTEHGTPPSTPPFRPVIEESMTPLPSLNEIPIMGSVIGTPGFHLSPRIIDPEAAGKLQNLYPYNTPTMTPPDGNFVSGAIGRVDAVSELRLPTVMVSSAGLSAIPLVPASRSMQPFPSFFTANLQTTCASMMPQRHPFPVHSVVESMGYPYVGLGSQSLSTVFSPSLPTLIPPTTSLPEPSVSGV